MKMLIAILTAKPTMTEVINALLMPVNNKLKAITQLFKTHREVISTTIETIVSLSLIIFCFFAFIYLFN
ncbi:MAG TPA: hypothetical protein DCL77_14660 [Prolixibacteraceae bacterium]|nr:hypothetical protein [Prolixibacteraceae bacterium]